MFRQSRSSSPRLRRQSQSERPTYRLLRPYQSHPRLRRSPLRRLLRRKPLRVLLNQCALRLVSSRRTPDRAPITHPSRPNPWRLLRLPNHQLRKLLQLQRLRLRLRAVLSRHKPDRVPFTQRPLHRRPVSSAINPFSIAVPVLHPARRPVSALLMDRALPVDAPALAVPQVQAEYVAGPIRPAQAPAVGPVSVAVPALLACCLRHRPVDSPMVAALPAIAVPDSAMNRAA